VSEHDEARHCREVAARRFHGTAWTHQHWLVKWVDSGDEQALLHYLGRGERYPMIGMAEDIATERAAARLAALREAAEVLTRAAAAHRDQAALAHNSDAARLHAGGAAALDSRASDLLALATRARGGTCGAESPGGSSRCVRPSGHSGGHVDSLDAGGSYTMWPATRVGEGSRV
jgi:hypothetical protein